MQHDEDDNRYCQRCYRHTLTWEANNPGFRNTAGSEVTGSNRCYGIELETSYSPKYRTLRNATVFGAKFDGSISGMEFISPILQGDSGLQEIEAFCAHARRLGFNVDGDCGYHVHIDLRDTNSDQRSNIAYAYRLTYEVWASLVNEYRANDCNYCRAPEYSASDLPVNGYDFDYWAEYSSRYSFINFASYRRHQTFEIRGYQGTLDARKIIAWVKAHVRFVDFVKDKTREEIYLLFGDTDNRTWANLRRVMGADLARHYGRKRAARLSACNS